MGVSIFNSGGSSSVTVFVIGFYMHLCLPIEVVFRSWYLDQFRRDTLQSLPKWNTRKVAIFKWTAVREKNAREK